MLVLPNRRCGTPEKGALYMVSRESVFGTLALFTAIASPLPAEVRNSRKPEVVDTSRTLTGLAGLIHPDPHVSFGRFARLPRIGIADFWGQSRGYRNVWDCVEETRRLGVCRKVANVFDVPLPCPVLMLHAEAVITPGRAWSSVGGWLFGQGIEWDVAYYQGEDATDIVTVEKQPWREVGSLGRVGDDDFSWHPYVELWGVVSKLRERRLFSKFRDECSIRFEEGVFGLSWISDFVYTLKDDEAEVPVHLAEKGVVGALTQDDPRVKEVE